MPRPLLLLAPAALALGGSAPDGVQVTTMTFHEHITIRVPRLGTPPPAAPAVWVESRGPRCIAAATLAGALVPAPGIVDLVLQGERRVRARLDEGCDPFDFYSGFYLRPSSDGRVCAGRDVIRTRSGVSCAINRFRTLKVKARR